MLETIGVGESLGGQGCAIRSIRVSDGLEPGGLIFDPPAGDDPLGMMFENRLLRAALRDTALGCKNVNLVMPGVQAEVHRDSTSVRVALTDSRLLTAPLLVGAEGRSSPTRDAAQIPLASWSYDHVPVVATIPHERHH